MNSKRRSSPRTKQPSASRPSAQAPASPLPSTPLQYSEADQFGDQLEDGRLETEVAANLNEIRQIEGSDLDWRRWDNLALQLKQQESSPLGLLSQILTWAELQAADEAIAELDLPQGTAFQKTLGMAAQLLVSLNGLTVQLQQQQQQLNDALVQVLQTLTSGFGPPRQGVLSSSRRTAVASKESFSEFDSEELKKSHAKGSAEEKLRRAFQAIVAHNEVPDRSHADQWAINQNALAELTGCNRPAIKQFLKQYGDEIEAHHQQHNLQPRHNYSHGKSGVKITNVIRW